jgi:hypothetical protein
MKTGFPDLWGGQCGPDFPIDFSVTDYKPIAASSVGLSELLTDDSA